MIQETIIRFELHHQGLSKQQVFALALRYWKHVYTNKQTATVFYVRIRTSLEHTVLYHWTWYTSVRHYIWRNGINNRWFSGMSISIQVKNVLHTLTTFTIEYIYREENKSVDPAPGDRFLNLGYEFISEKRRIHFGHSTVITTVHATIPLCAVLLSLRLGLWSGWWRGRLLLNVFISVGAEVAWWPAEQEVLMLSGYHCWTLEQGTSPPSVPIQLAFEPQKKLMYIQCPMYVDRTICS